MTTPPRFIIIDYGMGNLRSVVNAFRFLGCDAAITGDGRGLASADAIILPGVGAFGQAMQNLRAQGLLEPLTEQVLHRRKPFLGICLGMQLIAQDSEEGGTHAGLGWISGKVKKIPVPEGYRLPHVGWNNVTVLNEVPLFHGMGGDRNFFFVHSYHVECDPALVTAATMYGCEVTAALQYNNIFAVQFHPEKSQHNGLRLLRNFTNHAAKSAGKERE